MGIFDIDDKPLLIFGDGMDWTPGANFISTDTFVTFHPYINAKSRSLGATSNIISNLLRDEDLQLLQNPMDIIQFLKQFVRFNGKYKVVCTVLGNLYKLHIYKVRQSGSISSFLQMRFKLSDLGKKQIETSDHFSQESKCRLTSGPNYIYLEEPILYENSLYSDRF